MSDGSSQKSTDTGNAAPSSTRSGRRRLGRGLGSLIGAPVVVESKSELPAAGEASERLVHREDAPAAEGSAEDKSSDLSLEHRAVLAESPDVRFEEVDVASIRPNPHQPRRVFDDHGLDELAASIRSSGVIQPIVVRPLDAGSFELIAGERRLMSARRAGLTTVPAIIRTATDRESARLALIENLQREDLNPIERANAFHRLTELFGLTHAEVAEQVGLERATVSNLLRLLELEDELQSLVATSKLTMGHARALLSVSRGTPRITLARQTIAEQWSVRQLEKVVRSAVSDSRLPPSLAGRGGSAALGEAAAEAHHVRDLEEQLTKHLGTRVRIHTGKRKGAGRVEISFHSLDEFDELMNRLGFTGD